VVHQRFVGGLSEGDVFNYDEEQLLLIGDWFHRPAVEVQASYLTSNSSADEVRNFQRNHLPKIDKSSASSRFASYQWAWGIQLLNGDHNSADRVPRCPTAKHEGITEGHKIASNQRRVRWSPDATT
jgi:hypothetical protein